MKIKILKSDGFTPYHFSNKKSGKGFTLVETMVYIALFAILMSGAIAATYELLEGGDRNEASVSIQEEGTFLDRKINWALTGASATLVSGGGSTLTITRPDLGAQSPLVITGASGALTIKRGASAPVQLNSETYAVTSVVFTITPASGGRPPSITVSFLVQNKPFVFRTYLRQ